MEIGSTHNPADIRNILYTNRLEMEELSITLAITDWLNASSFFSWFVDNASYLFVFVFMVVESSFIPFPSEVVVPPAVYIGLSTGNMNVILIVILATLGAMLGATINYYLSLWLGRPLVYRFANSRVGHMCLIDEDKVKKSETFFDRHGAAATFFGRLIPAVRQLVSIPAGLAKMNILKFETFTGLGALLWNIILAILGYLLYCAVPDINDLFVQIEKYNSYLTIGGLCLLAVLVGYIIYKSRHKKKAGQSTDCD